MTKNIVFVSAALLGAGAMLASCDFTQPEPGCIVQDASLANWYAKYDLVGSADNFTEACKKTLLKGETLGVFKFTDPDEPGTTKLTIRPSGLASRATRDPGDPYLQTAVGKLSEEPDDDNFCLATDFAQAAVSAAPSIDGKEPATTITYQFESVRVYSAPDTPGTQLTGQLTYTRDGCTSQYVVRAMWPYEPCVPGSGNPSETCGEGSGVNPDFAVTCDEDLKVCVPEGDIPAIKR